MLALCLTNPLLLWCFTSSETYLIPCLSMILWSLCASLQQRTFSRNAVIVGLSLLVLFSAAMPFFWLVLPVLASLTVLISPRLLIKHQLTPFLIIMMPLIFAGAGFYYWFWSTGEASDLWRFFTNVRDTSTIWEIRHEGRFASAMAEMACWALLICPLVVLGLFQAPSALKKRLCGCLVLIPVLGAAIGSDFHALPTPLPHLAMLATAHIWMSGVLKPYHALAGHYVSWLGSYLAIWYYTP
ncbi:hypothetical protein [Parvularcula sp. IMCC14364]|uniref:hypothetical protein n=1 Tax=Parvularcula sp. IMCC14364 TaxID=3067902 RepID=UPI0027426F5D|nr:hypothetical protein [Parvularcula sp. IMCC14364]